MPKDGLCRCHPSTRSMGFWSSSGGSRSSKGGNEGPPLRPRQSRRDVTRRPSRARCLDNGRPWRRGRDQQDLARRVAACSHALLRPRIRAPSSNNCIAEKRVFGVSEGMLQEYPRVLPRGLGASQGQGDPIPQGSLAAHLSHALQGLPPPHANARRACGEVIAPPFCGACRDAPVVLCPAGRVRVLSASCRPVVRGLH